MFKTIKRWIGSGKKAIREELLQALEENDQLRERITVISEPHLLALALEPGGSMRMDLEPNVGMQILAASFADTILGTPNWVSVEIGPFPSSEGRLLVTVRRVGGETPASTCSKRRQTIEMLLEMIEERVLRNPAIRRQPDNLQDIQSVFNAAKASIDPSLNPKTDAEIVRAKFVILVDI